MGILFEKEEYGVSVSVAKLFNNKRNKKSKFSTNKKQMDIQKHVTNFEGNSVDNIITDSINSTNKHKYTTL